jgi:hypothetical protein
MENATTPPLFNIDRQEMETLLDKFKERKKADRDEKIKSCISRLEKAEQAIAATQESLRTLFALHTQLDLADRISFNNPTSLYFTSRNGEQCVQNRMQQPNLIITENCKLGAMCVVKGHADTGKHAIFFDSYTLRQKIEKNGIYGNDMLIMPLRLSCENYTSYGNYKYVLDNGLKYGGLIDLLEIMVKELPIYAKAFVDYIKDKGK